jgi:uncharacterized protein (TIGR02246 family)
MEKLLLFTTILLLNCNRAPIHYISQDKIQEIDAQKIAGMILAREKAMISKNLLPAMEQFSEDATWINSQGYYFKGRPEIEKFHKMMFGNDSLDYVYVAGTPEVRLLDNRNAVAYYGWQMNWINRLNRLDTVKKEIGLMTLTAQKVDSAWQWKAITNQHTPWFYDKITPVAIE